MAPGYSLVLRLTIGPVRVKWARVRSPPECLSWFGVVQLNSALDHPNTHPLFADTFDDQP